MSEKTGRPKEQGGHKRRNLSFDKLTNEALNKIKGKGGKISQFIEKALRPELENLDPGEASVEIWRYEAYLNRKISEALIQDKPGKAKALTSILVALKDFRSLCGIPPLDPNLLSTEERPLWKKQAFEDFTSIRDRINKQDPDDLALIPEATLSYLETYPKLVEQSPKLKHGKTGLEFLIKQAYNTKDLVPYAFIRNVVLKRRLRNIAKNYVRHHILEEVFKLLHES
jgi:hypothetical protein